MISQHEFRKMTKEEQIQLLEKLFDEGKTVPGMARVDLDYSDKQLRGIVSDLGFKYNNKSKQYEFIKSNNISNNELVVEKLESNEQSNLIGNLKSSNESNSLGNILSNNSSNNQSNNDMVTREEFDQLKCLFDELSKRVQDLNLETEHAMGAMMIKRFKSEPVNRTFKIYEEVQESFKEFCEKHKKDHRVQDLISQALYEFMEKYS